MSLVRMRFFAALVFVAMMMVLAVSAAPKNVPTWDPETVAEFNSQQQQQQGSKRSLQEAVHQWLNPDKVPSPLSPPCTSLAVFVHITQFARLPFARFLHSSSVGLRRLSVVLRIQVTNMGRQNGTLHPPSTTGFTPKTPSPPNSNNAATSPGQPEKAPLASYGIGKPPLRRNSDSSPRIKPPLEKHCKNGGFWEVLGGSGSDGRVARVGIKGLKRRKRL